MSDFKTSKEFIKTKHGKNIFLLKCKKKILY